MLIPNMTDEKLAGSRLARAWRRTVVRGQVKRVWTAVTRTTSTGLTPPWSLLRRDLLLCPVLSSFNLLEGGGFTLDLILADHICLFHFACSFFVRGNAVRKEFVPVLVYWFWGGTEPITMSNLILVVQFVWKPWKNSRIGVSKKNSATIRHFRKFSFCTLDLRIGDIIVVVVSLRM